MKQAARYELGFIAALAPVYLRGQAYLMFGAGPEAAWEFQRIVDHRAAIHSRPSMPSRRWGSHVRER